MGVHVYMLRCADGSYYIGSTTGDDIGPRIDQHNAGTYKGYTLTRRPVVLVWSEYFDRITDGIAVERQLKGWSRAKKEALISADWTTISALARRPERQEIRDEHPPSRLADNARAWIGEHLRMTELKVAKAEEARSPCPNLQPMP